MAWSYEPFQECKCPVCGRSYIKSPGHIYKVFENGVYKYVCSWGCVMKYEKSHPLKKRGRKKLGG